MPAGVLDCLFLHQLNVTTMNFVSRSFSIQPSTQHWPRATDSKTSSLLVIRSKTSSSAVRRSGIVVIFFRWQISFPLGSFSFFTNYPSYFFILSSSLRLAGCYCYCCDHQHHHEQSSIFNILRLLSRYVCIRPTFQLMLPAALQFWAWKCTLLSSHPDLHDFPLPWHLLLARLCSTRHNSIIYIEVAVVVEEVKFSVRGMNEF